MPEHRIEVVSRDMNETYSSVALPVEATEAELDAARFASKQTVEQMLGRFGLSIDLAVVTIPNAPTEEESRANLEAAHNSKHLPSTDEVLTSMQA